MRWTTLVCALSALAATAPLVNAEGELLIAEACYPAADASADEYGDLYLKEWGKTTRYIEIWQEQNGIPGLQLDNGMACGRGADVQRMDLCAGTGGCVL